MFSHRISLLACGAAAAGCASKRSATALHARSGSLAVCCARSRLTSAVMILCWSGGKRSYLSSIRLDLVSVSQQLGSLGAKLLRPRAPHRPVKPFHVNERITLICPWAASEAASALNLVPVANGGLPLLGPHGRLQFPSADDYVESVVWRRHARTLKGVHEIGCDKQARDRASCATVQLISGRSQVMLPPSRD
jgi:hypothetical protein